MPENTWVDGMAPYAVAASLAVMLCLSGCSPDSGNHGENCTKLMSQAVEATKQTHYAKAEELLQNAIGEATRSDDLLQQPQAWTQMGDVQLRAKEPEKADGSYRQALKLYEDILSANSGDGLQRRSVARTHAEVEGKLADALSQEGRLKDAEAQFKQALEEGKQSFISLELQNDLTRRLAKVLAQMNMKSESAQLQSDVMANEGEKTSKTALVEGETLLDKGDDPEAKVRFLSALTMAKQRNLPRDASSALYFLAQMEFWDGHLEQAQKYVDEGYELARKLPPDNTDQVCYGLTILGIIKQAQGQEQAGQKMIAQAAQLNGGTCATEFSGIATHFYGKRKYAQAAVFFRRAIDILDKYPAKWSRIDQTRGQWRAQILEALANCYTQTKQYEPAHKAYVELLTENTFLPLADRARYLQMDAAVLAKQGKFPAAEKALAEEISIVKSQNLPKDRLALPFFCMANLCLQEDRSKDAEEYFRQAIDAAPPGLQQAVCQRKLAELYVADGNFAQSSELYEKLLPWKDKMNLHQSRLFLQQAADSFRKAHRDAQADEIEKSISEKPM
jgi:tetratricopeptide (TPR) repeat protein